MLIVTISIVLMTIAYQNSRTANAVDLLRKTQTQNQANLEQLRARVATHVASTDLLERLDKTRRLLANHQDLYDVLTHKQLGNNSGFSNFLVDLAQHKPKALWLRQIKMDSGGQRIDLHGSALDPTAIPIYLQLLGSETSLAGRGVKQIEIAQAQATHLDFAIRTESRP